MGFFAECKLKSKKQSNVVVHNRQKTKMSKILWIFEHAENFLEIFERFNNEASWKFARTKFGTHCVGFLLLIIFSLPKDFKAAIKKTNANNCAHKIK